MSQPSLALIVGPTAVGKTEAAIQLARQLNAEIVSADSRLFYRGMEIGTAKPSVEDRAAVPHHLIDVADPDETLNLSVFQGLARQAISEIYGRRKLPILVGGTGQYVRAVTEGWQPPAIKPNLALRSRLEALSRQNGPDWLHAKLARLDPDAAEGIDARNVRRTIRALEVVLSGGHKFSEQRRRSAPPYRVIGIGLRRPRAELYARIDARIEQMFEQGLVDEVKGLLASGYSPDLPALSAIGYRETIMLVRGEISLEEAKALIRRATRGFVRRQSNWFKETDPGLMWFEAGDTNLVSQLEAHVRRQLQSVPVSAET